MNSELGLTDLFILGLLRERPMYGYEIKQIVDEWHTERWARITQSAIYYSLRKLKRFGLVEMRSHMEGHLEQRVYSVTEQGLATFSELLAKRLAATEDLYPEYSIALLFRNTLDKEQLRESFLKRRQFLLDRIAEHEDCLDQSRPPIDIVPPALGRRGGDLVPGRRSLWFYRSELAWLEKALADLAEDTR